MKALQLQIRTQSELDHILLHSFLQMVKHLRKFIIIIIIIIILIIYSKTNNINNPGASSVCDVAHRDQTRPADAHYFWAK
jgi:hypothetical protein